MPPPFPAPTSLRARTRALIRDEITARAMDLFRAHGFDATTVNQIAEAAGISPRTFFRYFPTKEDVVIGDPPDLAAQLVATMVSRPADEPVWDALRETLRMRTARWQADPELTGQIVQLVADSDELRARMRQRVMSWQDVLVPDTARRLGDTDQLAEMRASAIVAAALACLDTAFFEWQRGTDTRSLDELFDEAVRAVRG